MAKRKTKRVVTWVVASGADGYCYKMDLRSEAVRCAKDWDTLHPETAPHRAVRLREVTPAEEAVLRAARAYVLDGDWGTEGALVRAVERMEKEQP
jgi:hypothetical protein